MTGSKKDYERNMFSVPNYENNARVNVIQVCEVVLLQLYPNPDIHKYLIDLFPEYSDPDRGVAYCWENIDMVPKVVNNSLIPILLRTINDVERSNDVKEIAKIEEATIRNEALIIKASNKYTQIEISSFQDSELGFLNADFKMREFIKERKELGIYKNIKLTDDSLQIVIKALEKAVEEADDFIRRTHKEIIY